MYTTYLGARNASQLREPVRPHSRRGCSRLDRRNHVHKFITVLPSTSAAQVVASVRGDKSVLNYLLLFGRILDVFYDA